MNFQKKEQLKANLELLMKSVDYLEYSLANCRVIGVKEEYTMAELSEFESLSGRFSRSSDICTQKVLKSIFIYLQEDVSLFIDRCHLAEKIGVIQTAEELFNIRQLRNQIAHEYSQAEISDIFDPLLEYSDSLVQIIQNIEQYIIGLLEINTQSPPEL